eukprot:9078123-Lingulodinium_polyedra.AAC.1
MSDSDRWGMHECCPGQRPLSWSEASGLWQPEQKVRHGALSHTHDTATATVTVTDAPPNQ